MQKKRIINNRSLTIAWNIAWLLPILLALLVCLSGASFCYVGLKWQQVNRFPIFVLSVVASCAFVFAVALTKHASIRFISKLQMPTGDILWSQKIFLYIITLIAGYGLYKSFGGFIFEKSYHGAAEAWLGCGAWSVLYLFCLVLLAFSVLSCRCFCMLIALLSFVALTPALLSGSRIDFLSLIIALSVVIMSDTRMSLSKSIVLTLSLATAAIYVSLLLGQLRYSLHDVTATQLKPSMLAVSLPSSSISSVDIIYLSTLGDIAVSVFQVYGLTETGVANIIGIASAVKNYFIRLLPGSFFPVRPQDICINLPENIGSGALHSLGEAYLAGGMLGAIFFGILLGGIFSISLLARDVWERTRHPYAGLVFVFPWLLLIRGTWYQFFSIIKSAQILIALLMILSFVGFIERKVVKKRC